MSSTTRFIVRVVLRLLQLCCLYFVFLGIANIDPMITATKAWLNGDASVADVCWKILPVTAVILPTLGVFSIVQVLLGVITPTTHDPSEPWMANPMWADRHIRLNNKGTFWAVVLLIMVYLGIIVPFSFANPTTPFLVLCGIFGLVFLLFARVFWLNRKWNTAELRMADLPGVIGGPFSGVAILQEAFPAGTAFDVCLKCEFTQSYRKKGWSSSGERTRDSETRTETVWSSTISIDKTLPPDSPNRTLIPFSFAIPFDCLPTSVHDNSSKGIARWNLVVKEKNRVGFGGSVFNVPIFQTPESRPDFELDNDLVAPFQLEVNVDTVLKRVGLKREVESTGDQRLVFEQWNLISGLSMAFTAMVFLAIVLGCFWFIQDRYAAFFVSVIPGLLFLVVMYSLLDSLLWRTLIEKNGSGLRFESGWRGFRKSLVVDESEKPIFTSQLQALKENGEWYRVVVDKRSIAAGNDTGEGCELTLVKNLDGRAEADAVTKWLGERFYDHLLP
jgi:hypothetical protein